MARAEVASDSKAIIAELKDQVDSYLNLLDERDEIIKKVEQLSWFSVVKIYVMSVSMLFIYVCTCVHLNESILYNYVRTYIIKTHSSESRGQGGSS